MAVTVRELAEYAGVSVATVGNVLGTNRHRYAEATQEKVLDAVRELGYRPNGIARAMRAGAFGSIGLLLSTHRFRSNLPGALLNGIHDTLHEHDLHLTLTRLPDEQLRDEHFVPKILRESLSDGLLINYHFGIPPQMIELIRQHNVPTVWINCKQDCDAVRPDDLNAGIEATRRLIDAGHTRIAYLDPAMQGVEAWGELHYSRRDRLEGYRSAMTEAGFEPRLITRLKKGSGEAADRCVAILADILTQNQRPTAFVAQSDSDVQLLREAAERCGMGIPGDFSTITFRNEQVTARQQNRCDAMVVPEAKIGCRAVEMLLRRIAEPDTRERTQCIRFAYESMNSIRPNRNRHRQINRRREKNSKADSR